MEKDKKFKKLFKPREFNDRRDSNKEIILLRVRKEEDAKRLDKYLIHHLGDAAFSNIQKLIRKKDIRVNAQKSDSNYQTKIGDVVSMPKFIYDALKNNKPLRLSNFDKPGFKPYKKPVSISAKDVEEFKKYIIHEDASLIVLNKPSGLAVQGGSKVNISVDNYLFHLKKANGETPLLVHRIDKDTSGLLLIAKNIRVSEVLARFFKMKDNLEKIYYAIVVGKPTKEKNVISLPLLKKFHGDVEKVYVDHENGKTAITEYEVISYSEKYNISLLKIRIITGRTHQIRVHMKEIGYPVLGDGKYGGQKSHIRGLSSKLHLHAYSIKINNFVGKNLEFKAELSNHIKETIELSGLELN